MIGVGEQGDGKDRFEIRFIKAGKGSTAVGGLHLRSGNHMGLSLGIGVGAAIETPKFVVQGATKRDVNEGRAHGLFVIQFQIQTFGRLIETPGRILAVDECSGDIKFDGIQNYEPRWSVDFHGDDYPAIKSSAFQMRFE